MALSDVARPVAAQGIVLIDELFRHPGSVGAIMAGEYLGPLGEPEIIRLSISETARDLLMALNADG